MDNNEDNLDDSFYSFDIENNNKVGGSSSSLISGFKSLKPASFHLEMGDAEDY